MSATPRVCRMCERPAHVRPITRHHLVPQWWFRDQAARSPDARSYWYPEWRPRANVHANIIPLCRPCHDLIDHGPDHWKRIYRGWLRRRLTVREVEFVRGVMGTEWLDDAYPPTAGHPPTVGLSCNAA